MRSKSEKGVEAVPGTCAPVQLFCCLLVIVKLVVASEMSGEGMGIDDAILYP